MPWRPVTLLVREFKVTPGRVFPGDKNIAVRIVFDAPGPMYGSTLAIDYSRCSPGNAPLTMLQLQIGR